MNRRIGKLVGHEIVGPIVEGMDVDAIVNQIDVDELIEKVDLDRVLSRVDLNEVLSRVDLNALFDRVDLNRQLHRVDLDRLLENVDLTALIERSNLEGIIARSTSGVCMSITDIVRTRLAWLDQWIQRAAQCRCCAKPPLLSKRPGRPKDSSTPWPTKGLHAREFGVAVQFRTCGLGFRWAATAIDNFLVLSTYALLVWIFAWFIEVFTDHQYEDWTWDDQFQWLPKVLLGLYAVSYQVSFLGCFGRTIGMWILGILVVGSNGHRVTFCQVFVRTITIPLNYIFFGWVLGFLRRDGRMWNDLLGCTAVVYSWNARILPKKGPVGMPLSYTDYSDSISENRTSKKVLFLHDSDLVDELAGGAMKAGNGCLDV